MEMICLEYFDIFISYRRDTGSEVANLLKSELATQNYNCFLDTDNLGAGDFREQLDPYIKQCKAILVLITEGHIERYANQNDICAYELATALKYNKKVIVVTNIIRKEVRQKLANIENLPDIVRKLSDYNTYYLDVQSTKSVIIDKLVAVMKEVDLELYKALMGESTNKVTLPITILKEQFTYTGSLSQSKELLAGPGVIVDTAGTHNIKIEGDFSCPLNNISGDVIITLANKKIFKGYLEKINSLQPFSFTGFGKYYTNDTTLHGSYVKGKPSGLMKIVNSSNGYSYLGFYKEGMKNGWGTLKNKSVTYKGIFKNNKPQGDFVTVIDKYGALLSGKFINGFPINQVHLTYNTSLLKDYKCMVLFKINRIVKSITVNSAEDGMKLYCTLEDGYIRTQTIFSISPNIDSAIFTAGNSRVDIKVIKGASASSIVITDNEMQYKEEDFTPEEINLILDNYAKCNEMLSIITCTCNELLQASNIFEEV